MAMARSLSLVGGTFSDRVAPGILAERWTQLASKSHPAQPIVWLRRGALGFQPQPASSAIAAISRINSARCLSAALRRREPLRVPSEEEGGRTMPLSSVKCKRNPEGLGHSERPSPCTSYSPVRRPSGEKSAARVKATLAMAEESTNGLLESERSQHFERDELLKTIAGSIRAIPDFPKPGVLFRDVTTLLLNPKAFKDCIAMFVERYAESKIDVVAGIEARGFIFGPPIALALGAKFVPVRKAKKLPGEVIGEEYTLEYGTDKVEIHVGAVIPGDRVILIDDLIATGGTLCAAFRLMERVGATVVECGCVIELPELKGRAKLNGMPLFTLLEFEGH